MEEKFETMDNFCSYVCNCACSNDWYCSEECELLQKARKIPFEKINAKWIEHDGDIKKVARYIKNYWRGKVNMINDLYFKNGKQKKKFMLCESKEKVAELKKLYGREIIQCAGLGCPYYSRGCKK